MPKMVNNDEVAKHDNTLEPDPDPIVNGDDVGAAIGLPIKRKAMVDKEEEQGDDSSVTAKKQEPKLEIASFRGSLPSRPAAQQESCECSRGFVQLSCKCCRHSRRSDR